ncbi:MAG TPA: arginine--tRNA ligase [Bacteroidales bacterium]|nr:MAG: arginine--tRNA ligase [Bacteroidetes bacterium GWF2_33_38]HBF88489.1 arginine--tRNA ligase [Bacteroidales bacterium]
MIEQVIKENVIKAILEIYGENLDEKLISVQQTKKEFDGDFTIVVFPFVKQLKKSPETIANEIGNYVKENVSEIADYNVIKGFLNFSLTNQFWFDYINNNNISEKKFRDEVDIALFPKKNIKHHNFLDSDCKSNNLFFSEKSEDLFVIEYSSPNTNKPLHLGHIRNNLLGYSVAELLKESGRKVVKVNLINDRGIHICKSMLAWQKWGNNETPESKNMKGDSLVGKYYVKFDVEYKKEIFSLIAGGMGEEEAKQKSPSMIQAQEMLRMWEAGDEETIKLWRTMNSWVYSGFDVTYKRMGVDFDKLYYESETYLLGKEVVQKGLDAGILTKKEDGSVWIDLTKEGLDEKLLLRSDGTSVYMTQDIGTAILRFNDYKPDKFIYVVGNEQNYHFQVLKIVLDKLGYDWSDKLYHLSYGMVELPDGKMKSREGTVVDADDLIDEMIHTAKTTSDELGKLSEFSEQEKNEVHRMIGLGALKYFLLKVDPKKNIVFNPKESIDFNGNTGPFIQYTCVRIKSLLRKANEQGIDVNLKNLSFESIKEFKKEIILLKKVYDYHLVIQEAAIQYSPALIANYAYELAKEFNQYYQENPILVAEEDERKVRLALSKLVGFTIEQALKILGIEVPERM